MGGDLITDPPGAGPFFWLRPDWGLRQLSASAPSRLTTEEADTLQFGAEPDGSIVYEFSKMGLKVDGA